MILQRLLLFFICTSICATGFAQSITVEKYLEDPNVYNTRSITLQAPKILPVLIEKFESSESTSEKVACLRALYSCRSQTDQTRKFFEDIFAEYDKLDANTTTEPQTKILNHALVGAWLNDPWNSEHLKAWPREILQSPSESPIPFVRERLLDAIVQYPSPANVKYSEGYEVPYDLFFLLDIVNDQYPEIVKQFCERRMEVSIPVWFKQNSQELDEDEVSYIVEEFDYLARRVDGYRNLLAKILSNSAELTYLGDRRSIKVGLLQVCLAGLKEDFITKPQFDSLKRLALSPQKASAPENETDEAWAARRTVVLGFLLELQGIIKLREDHRRDNKEKGVAPTAVDTDKYVVNFMEKFACEVVPPFLSNDLAEARFVAKDVISMIGDPEFGALKIYQTAVTRLLGSGDQNSVIAALSLFGENEPTESQLATAKAMVSDDSGKTTPYLRIKAAQTLAGLEKEPGHWRKVFLNTRDNLWNKLSLNFKLALAWDNFESEPQQEFDRVVGLISSDLDDKAKQEIGNSIASMLNFEGDAGFKRPQVTSLSSQHFRLVLELSHDLLAFDDVAEEDGKIIFGAICQQVVSSRSDRYPFQFSHQNGKANTIAKEIQLRRLNVGSHENAWYRLELVQETGFGVVELDWTSEIQALTAATILASKNNESAVEKIDGFIPTIFTPPLAKLEELAKDKSDPSHERAMEVLSKLKQQIDNIINTEKSKE